MNTPTSLCTTLYWTCLRLQSQVFLLTMLKFRVPTLATFKEQNYKLSHVIRVYSLWSKQGLIFINDIAPALLS